MPPNDYNGLEGYRSRLSTELTPELSHFISQVLPHGWQKPLIHSILNGVLELYQRGGIEAVGAVVSRHISLSTIIEIGFNHTKNTQIIELEKKLDTLRNGHD